jgi:hypothetical protein
MSDKSPICKVCKEEPAVYNGLCEICLSGDERDPDSGKFTLRHAPKREKKRRTEEESL